MALVLKDRVRVTSSTTGTGTFTLGAASAGYQDFSVIGDGNTTYYAIQNSGDNTWEVGIGTYTASGTTLSRDTILESSNGGTAVNFAAGTKDVFVTYPAEKGLYLDASGNSIGLGTPASATLTNATGLPISTGVSGLGSGIATFLTTPSSANLATAVTDETGSGSLVFATSPTLVTPVLGTPSSGDLTSCTGYTYANLSGTVPTWNQNTTGTAAGLSSTLVVGSGGTGTSTAFTTGSVVFAGASGTYTQNNANFFWDDTNNYLGIGTATPSTPLNVVANTSVDAVRITQTGAGNALVVEDSANPDSTPFVINAGGQIIQGNATNVFVANPVSGLALAPSFEIVGTSALTTPAFVRQDTSASPQAMVFAKSRGSVSSPTVVASADVIGRISFQGYDGANFIRAATIDAAVDGTPGTTDMPGRLIFSTTADGASTPTEAMRITSAGDIGIGTTSPSTWGKFAVVGASSGGQVVAAIANTSGTANTQAVLSFDTTNNGFNVRDSQIRATNNGGNLTTLEFYTSSAATPTEKMRIDSSGTVGIGTSSPSYKLDIRNSGGSNGIHLSNSGTNDTGAYINATGDAEVMFSGGANYNSYSAPNFVMTAKSTVASGVYCIGDGIRFWVNTGLTAGTTFNQTERMRIDSSGNVGIGTTSPAYKLDIAAGTPLRVAGTAGNAAGFEFCGNGSTYGTTSVFVGQGGDGTAFIYQRANGPMTFATNNTERMRIHSSGGVSIGNTTDSGAASLNVSGSMSGGYIAHANGTTAMAFGSDNVVRVTPNATATFTSTVPAAGAICVLSILTSGTSSYTITFGTGFKSTGTLATGTVSARYFNITFVSDGTNLIEMSRTTAIT